MLADILRERVDVHDAQFFDALHAFRCLEAVAIGVEEVAVHETVALGVDERPAVTQHHVDDPVPRRARGVVRHHDAAQPRTKYGWPALSPATPAILHQ